MLKSLWSWPERYGLKAFSIFLAFSIYMSATSLTWTTLGPEVGKAIAAAFYTDLPEFSDTPGPIEVGSNPTRDETYRSGLWDNELLPLLNNMETLEAT